MKLYSRMLGGAVSTTLSLMLTSAGAPSVALANIADTFGLGSRTTALGGAGVAWGFEGYSAYLNPAALPLTDGRRLILSFGIMDMESQFTPIEGVVIENEVTSDTLTRGSVNQSYRNTLGQLIGVTYQAIPRFLKLTVGVTAFLPLNQVAYIDTGETFIPEYVLYRARTQRPQFGIGVGGEIIEGLSLGAGFQVAYSLTASTSVFLQTSPDKPSTMRLVASLRPKAAPYLGALYVTKDQAFSAGTAVRFPVSSNGEVTVRSSARALGSGFAALDFNFSAASAFFYDPLTWEIGTSFEYLEGARAYVQLDYQAWDAFTPPAIIIQSPTTESCSGSSCGIQFSGSKSFSNTFTSIWIPRLGHEMTIGTTVIRAGYSYRPSILVGLPTETGNTLDPPKHMIQAGVGLRFRSFLGFETPCQLDLHGAYHAMVSQDVVKSSNTQIGAPGYQAGGKIFGGGVSVTLGF